MSHVDDKTYVIGVDVGTGSVRAGVFDLQGQLIGVAKRDITLFSAPGARYEQSSDDIWQAVCHSVLAAVEDSRINAESVIGVSFDATCSLVVIGPQSQPLAVDQHGIHQRNVIVWMDQRATEQAKRINEQGHYVLQYVGQRISPEMETPKLMWLKAHYPTTYHAAQHFFDLTDFLTWRASGSLARSICTTVCKWTYLAHEGRWDDSYFQSIGLGDLVEQNYQRIGNEIVPPGTPLANGLTQDAAAQMGLRAGITVAAGLIDAHAGGVGSVGAIANDGEANPAACLAYVFGTSACTLTSSVNRTTVPGVWGPYYSAMVPGLWLNEAGQSAAGAAIDHLMTLHPAYSELSKQTQVEGLSPAVVLSNLAKRQVASLSDVVFLADGVHVVPEFLGNRAPFADPEARAVIAGLDMDSSLDSLVKLYIAGICGLAYGLRQIIDAQASQGLQVSRVVISGGAGQDPLIRQIIADATRMEVVAPSTAEPVMLGAAMLAAVGAGFFADLEQAMKGMSSFGDHYLPADDRIRDRHNQRFEAFTRLQQTARELAC